MYEKKQRQLLDNEVREQDEVDVSDVNLKLTTSLNLKLHAYKLSQLTALIGTNTSGLRTKVRQ